MLRVFPSQVVRFIEQAFPDVLHKANVGQFVPLTIAHQTQVAALVAMIERVPEGLLIIQEDEQAVYFATIGTLMTAVRSWELRADTHAVYGLPGLHQHPIVVLRRLMSACPDEVISPATTGLEFIEDEALRQSIRRDVGVAGTALLNGEWKAATVLAGAACEALLLWRVQRMTPLSRGQHAEAARQRGAIDRLPPDDVTTWTLHQLLEVAAAARVILQETRDQLRLAKNFRNLIHPGREQRVGQVCDRATALSALAAMEHTIRDVSAQ